MTIKFLHEPETRDSWLGAADHDGPTQIGAYIPANLEAGTATLSVFWRGTTSRDWLRGTCGNANSALQNLSHVAVEGMLYAFGRSEETITTSGDELSQPVFWAGLTNFAAYRAELRAAATAIMPVEVWIWANVEDGDASSSLEERGENVGIAVSSGAFSRTRPFIGNAINNTRELPKPLISELFQAIAVELKNKGLGDTIR